MNISLYSVVELASLIIKALMFRQYTYLQNVCCCKQRDI